MFIVIDGTDGAGKSTQIDLLTKYFESQGRQVLVTRQPGGTPIGTDIRQMVKYTDKAMSSMCEALLFSADRAEHVRTVIGPALDEGKVVICDRYLASTYIYQGLEGGLVEEFDRYRTMTFMQFIRMATMYFGHPLTPNYEFILEVPLTVALERIRKRDESEGKPKKDRFELENRLAKVVEGFKSYVRNNCFSSKMIVSIDGCLAPDVVHQTIVEAMKTQGE